MVASHAVHFSRRPKRRRTSAALGVSQSCCSAVMSWISWVNARFPGAYRIPGNEPLLDECVQTIVSRSLEKRSGVALPINQANIFLASRSSLLERGGKCRWFLVRFELRDGKRMCPTREIGAVAPSGKRPLIFWINREIESSPAACHQKYPHQWLYLL